MKRNRKQSIVIFEDWVKYSRILTDSEFRELINSVFKYYQDQIDPQFEGNLAIVWEDIINDIQVNLSKKQKKQENMIKALQSNSKVNKPQTPNHESNSQFSPFERIINKTQDQPKSVAPKVSTDSPKKKIKMNIKPKSKQISPEINTSELTKELVIEKLNQSISSNELMKMYPEHSDMILDAIAEYMRSF